MKVAIVHEWLTTIGGSEKVLKAIASLFPQADIFTLVANKKTVQALGLDKHRVQTSFIQRLPLVKKKYRSYFPLYPLAIESFDLSGYDLVISSSHAAAKGALTFSHQVHICYCHSPIRYVWDLHFQYLKEANLDKGLKGLFVKYLLHRFRLWDVVSSRRVDHFIANSEFIAKRIRKNYGHTSSVIYPNVAVDNFNLASKESFYVTCSRMVPYKKTDIIVEAFSQMPGKSLVVIGDGPDLEKIKRKAGKNVEFVGNVPGDLLRQYFAKAKAFVYAAEEDFGIVLVEAQAAGTPVIAFRNGGAAEIIIDGYTGVLFDKQSTESLKSAVHDFESKGDTFDPEVIRQNALRFSEDRFKEEFSAYVQEVMRRRVQGESTQKSKFAIDSGIQY